MVESTTSRVQNFSVVHTRGVQNPSDFLSRHANQTTVETHEKMTEDYINFLITHAVPKAMSLSEIKQATKDDKMLHLIEMISTNQLEINANRAPDGVDLTELKLFGKNQR